MSKDPYHRTTKQLCEMTPGERAGYYHFIALKKLREKYYTDQPKYATAFRKDGKEFEVSLHETHEEAEKAAYDLDKARGIKRRTDTNYYHYAIHRRALNEPHYTEYCASTLKFRELDKLHNVH